MIMLLETNKVGGMDYAWCVECNCYLGPSLYWPLSKTVALHRQGTSHKIQLLMVGLFEENDATVRK